MSGRCESMSEVRSCGTPKREEYLDLPPNVVGENAEVKIAQWMQLQDMSRIEVLTIVDPLLDVKGEDLAFAASTFDENGRPAVAFTLTDAGSGQVLCADNQQRSRRDSPTPARYRSG